MLRGRLQVEPRPQLSTAGHSESKERRTLQHVRRVSGQIGTREARLGVAQRAWSVVVDPLRDNYNLKSHKYVCITTYQPDAKPNPNPNPNPNPSPTTKQRALVNIQLHIVACPMYPDKFIRDMLLHPLYYFRL